MIDLKPFCGKDETRPYLLAPFSVGEFTYATNGHILVRVARRSDVPEQSEATKKIEGAKPLRGLDDAKFSSLTHKPLSEFPEPKTHECSECEGSGKAHTCPDCECPCDLCDGTGSEKEIQSTSVRGQICDLGYMRMILALPSVEIADKTDANMPMLFKFDGGVGAMMPRRRKADHHYEIETETANAA